MLKGTRTLNGNFPTMFIGLRTYPTRAHRRQPLIDFMIEALRDSGCTILFASSASRAPFIVTFEAPSGERLGVIAYAFTATRTPTTNRPQDERSFQLKYGSKESFVEGNEHELWQDPTGLFTTVLIGIDTSERFFVGADPEMHNPTKLFIRLEFKDRQVAEIKNRKWYAWERGKRPTRDDRLEEGEASHPVEVLVGGTPDMFLRFVLFERAAKGLDPGNRQLLAEKPELFLSPLEATGSLQDSLESTSAGKHPLLHELGFEAEEVLEVIQGARRIKMAVRGWVAEEHLRRNLSGLPDVTECIRLDEEGSPDLRVRYRDRTPVYVECKNVLRDVNREGLPRVDFQRTRAAKSDPCSRYYSGGDFQILAASLHAVTETWEFRFVLTSELPVHSKCPGKIASNLVVRPTWTDDALQVLAIASSDQAG